MSRSNHDKSGKGPGYDYSSCRPGNRIGACPGKYGGRDVKTRTHRVERRRAAWQVRKETEE